MLDQNTDRMWYVIGAVIVGAALIFLMNNTFPGLFGSIGETFENKVGASTEMTDGIRPPTRGEDMGFEMSDIEQWRGSDHKWLSDTAISFTSDDQYMGGLFIPMPYFERDGEYVIAFDMTKLQGDIPGIGGHLFITDDAIVTIDGQIADVWIGGSKNPLNVNDWSKSVVYPNDTQKHHVEISFTYNKDPEGGNVGYDSSFYIQPNRSGGTLDYVANALSYSVLIENVVFYDQN